jgi:serine O-acetyltransferase
MKTQDIAERMIALQTAHACGIHTCLGTNMLAYSSVKRIVHLCRETLFPGYFGDALRQKQSIQQYVSMRIENLRIQLSTLTLAAYCFECKDNSIKGCPKRKECSLAADEFIEALPAINALLLSDASAIVKIDPAAASMDEVIFSYPGMRAIINHRIAHQLLLQGVPLVPRMISEMAHRDTGIDIHPAAQIGSHFAIDHGTGTVIGSTCIIGNNVSIYQGVTLGAKAFTLDQSGAALDVPRHPIIEDNVTIYAGAKVMGRITIGAGSVIGGNVWLTESVPPNTKLRMDAQHAFLTQSIAAGSR